MLFGLNCILGGAVPFVYSHLVAHIIYHKCYFQFFAIANTEVTRIYIPSNPERVVKAVKFPSSELEMPGCWSLLSHNDRCNL